MLCGELVSTEAPSSPLGWSKVIVRALSALVHRYNTGTEQSFLDEYRSGSKAKERYIDETNHVLERVVQALRCILLIKESRR